MIDVHADVVGSLLRPQKLLEARGALAAGTMRPAEFKRIEDEAVDQSIALQEDVGLQVATDGEMRRVSFQSQMTAAVEGFSDHDLNAFVWGRWENPELGDWQVDRPPLAVIAPLRRRRHLSAEEFTYLRGRTQVAPKVTLPSPTLFVNFWSKERSREVYPTLDAFLEAVTEILRDEVSELVRLGARYIQIDAPHYTSLLDPRTRGFYEEQGWSAERWLSRGVELENRVMEGFAEVTFGFHL